MLHIIVHFTTSVKVSKKSIPLVCSSLLVTTLTFNFFSFSHGPVYIFEYPHGMNWLLIQQVPTSHVLFSSTKLTSFCIMALHLGCNTA